MGLTREVQDSEHISVAEVVVYAVSDLTDVNSQRIDPIYEAIDPDALNALVEHADDESSLQVTFTFGGCDVKVAGDGTIYVREASGE